MKRLACTIGACIALLAASLLSAGSASADITCGETGSCTSSETLQLVSDACVQMQQYGVTPPDGMCNGTLEAITQTVSVGAPELPTTADLAAAPSSLASSGPPAGTRCRTWYQTEQSAINSHLWKEQHVGKYCYTKNDVWNGGKYGTYHTCDHNSGAGFTIDVTDCSENIVYTSNIPAGYFRQNWDSFKVSAVYNGFPIHSSHTMHSNVFPGGSLRFHIDN